MSVQYRVVVAKKDERVDGPDDADVVVTVGLTDAAADDFDPTVAYMPRRAEGVRSHGHRPRSAEVGRRGSGHRRPRRPTLNAIAVTRCRVKRDVSTRGSLSRAHGVAKLAVADQRGAT